jgi:CheY-like chemotaxis protein/anti-sigma regulatory factor (Ser/Thr protein kinase)
VLAERTCADFHPMLAEAGIALAQRLGETPVWVEADDTRISQVVGNLLHNAIKFTPAGGTITLALQAAGGEALLLVQDTGAGMEPGAIPGMFEPFAQGAQSLARSKGGLGLGLPLVRALVQLHGGRVTAHSDGPGRGALFTVALPLAPSATGPADGAPAAPASQPGPRPSTRGGSRDVLIVEDNHDAATTLAQLLELEGHRTRVAGDGATALALARVRRPDLVLCDIGLPGMDGYEIGRRLRADAALAGTRLVALSGYAQPEDRERSRAAGFDGHLAKPVDPQVVLAMLAGL